jgi:hypothetical protein
MPTQLPFGPMIDQPGRYDTLETWERFLAELEALPPSVTRNAALTSTKQVVRAKRMNQDKAAAKD